MTPAQERALDLADRADDDAGYERAHLAMRRAFPSIAAAYPFNDDSDEAQ
jgi:hypothetical protein